MKKYLLLMMLIAIKIMHAQHSIKFENPKTPDVYLFEKYGNIPISSYTGKLNISIPLHSITHGDIKIDLNLSYTSNGIRVDEESSQIGLGWYFSTGMITQSIQDKDDLKPNRVLKQPQYLWASSIGYPILPNPNWHVSSMNYYNGNLPNNSLSRVTVSASSPTLDKYFITRLRSESFLAPNTVYYDSNMANYGPALDVWYDNTDLSIDYFNASFFGHNLNFIIDGSGIKVLNKKGYKIEKNSTQVNPALIKYDWKITTPEGISYFFKEELMTYYQPAVVDSYSNTAITSNGTGYKNYTGNGSGNPTSSTSRIWKITKITDQKSNEINFNYETLTTIGSQSGTSGEAHFISIENTSMQPRNLGLFNESSTSLNYDGPILTTTDGGSTIMFYEQGKHIRSNLSYSQSITQQKSILKEIVYSDTKLEFINSSRIDIPLDKKHSSLKLWYKNDVIKIIDLSHTYFNQNLADNTQKRLKLDRISIGDQVYSFDYNLTQLPNKDSNSFDYWGYYNGMPNTTSINNPFRLYSNSSMIPAWAKYFLPMMEGIANRSAHPAFCKAGILEKITFPTGGTSEFVYELNEFDNYFFPDYNNKVGLDASNNYTNNYQQASSKGYGLRIKEIIDKDKNLQVTKRKYSYAGGKHIPAYVGYNDIDAFKCTKNAFIGNSNSYMRYSSFGSKITSYSSSIYQSGVFGNGDAVGYDNVTVENLDGSGQSNGKTIEYFTNIPDVNARTKFSNGGAIGPYSSLAASFCDFFGQSIRNTDVNNGLLIKKEIKDKDANLLKQIDYTYATQVLSNSSKYNIKSVRLPGVYGYYAGNFSSAGENLSNEYLFLYYPLKFSNSFIASEKTTDFFTSGSKWNTTSFTYNSNNVLTGKRLSDQFGNYFYEEISNMMATPYFINNNILDLPANTSMNENGFIKKKYNFLYNANSINLNKVEELPEGNATMVTNVFYDAYDEKNNLLQFHREHGMNTAIIWGYNKSFPIAKIENATYAEVASYAVNLQNLSNTDTEANLITALNALRTNLPKAMVTTYTHIPLVGVSTITDPKGDKKTFVYDSNNRLKQVKDQNGNILSENEYHFRP